MIKKPRIEGEAKRNKEMECLCMMVVMSKGSKIDRPRYGSAPPEAWAYACLKQTHEGAFTGCNPSLGN
jgi:hypothetical protein